MKKIITAKEQFVKDLESIGYYYSEPTVVTSKEKFWLTIDDGNIYLMFEVPKNLYFRYEYGRFSSTIEFYKSTKTIKGLVRHLTDKEDFSSIRAFMLALDDNDTGILEQFLPDIKQSYIESKTFGYTGKEVEVSTEEIEAIRKEIVERCKSHSIEEVRDMFQGYNWGEYGEDTFDFAYKGFVFCIGNKCDDYNPNEPYSLFLSTRVYTEDGETFTEIGSTITLPIPPKEIKLDMSDIVDEKPDLSDWGMTISYDYIVQRMRESCICRISDIYQKMRDKYVEIDTVKWLETHGHFADYQDYYTVALTYNSKGDVVLTGTDTAEWDENMTANDWSYVSLEEMLYIINQLTSK